jgi:hypothetical protein
MKKKLLCFILLINIVIISSIGTITFASTGEAQAKVAYLSLHSLNSNTKNIDNISLNSSDSLPLSDNTIVNMSDYNSIEQIKSDLIEEKLKDLIKKNKMVTFTGDSSNLNEKEMLKTLGITNGIYSESGDDVAKAMENNLCGISAQIVDGTVYWKKYYYVIDNKKIDDINNFVVDNSTDNCIMTSDNNALALTSSASSNSNNNNYDYSDIWHYSDNTLQITKSFTRTCKGSYSIWEVKSADQTYAGIWPVTQEVSRISVQGIGGETLMDHAPGSTDPDKTCFCYFTFGESPTFTVGWNFTNVAVNVTDSSVAGAYARWTFDYASGSAASTGVYIARPGAIFRNDYGDYLCDISNSISNGWGTSDTGVIRMYFTDLSYK